jgi:predicted metal-dependent peptidase
MPEGRGGAAGSRGTSGTGGAAAADLAAGSPGAYGHRGTRAVQRMVEYAPSTGGLALWVRHVDLPADAEVPDVATDGTTVYYGAGFAGLDLADQAGLIAHEVLHIALRHPQRFADLQARTGDADRQLFNVCADAIVNSTLAHLGWLSLPDGAVQLERLLLDALAIDQPVDVALLQWDVERLYRAVDDRRPSVDAAEERRVERDERESRRQAWMSRGAASREQRKGGRSEGGDQSDGGDAGRDDGGRDGRGGQRDETDPGGSGGRAGERADPRAAGGCGRDLRRRDGPRAHAARRMGGGHATDLLPTADAHEPPEIAAEQAREWAERLMRAHAGDGAFSMLRTLLADLPRSRTPWEQVLRVQLARGLAPKPALSWSRPSRSYIANQGRGSGGRRLPWEPGRSASQAVARLAVVIDVSGSIQDELLQRFSREIEAITRRLEAGVVLVIGDDKVRRVVEHAPGTCNLADIEFQGGGGTDFSPLLQEADAHRPDIGVVLTDLDGPAVFRPRWPVIWAVPEAYRSALAPFGRKVVID